MNAQLELDHCYDIEESVKASTDTDEDFLSFLLTLTTSAHLRWKLQKADILPAVSGIASQTRWWSSAGQEGEVWRARKNGGPGVTAGDLFKQKVGDAGHTREEKNGRG